MVFAEAVGVAVEVEDDGSVEEAVEEGGGDGGVAEDLAPGADAAVAGQDDGGFQVALETTWKRAEAASAGRGR